MLVFNRQQTFRKFWKKLNTMGLAYKMSSMESVTSIFRFIYIWQNIESVIYCKWYKSVVSHIIFVNNHLWFCFGNHKLSIARKKTSKCLHFICGPSKLTAARSTFYADSSDQNRWVEISHLWARRSEVPSTWQFLAMRQFRPVLSSAIWVAQRPGLIIQARPACNCTSKSTAMWCK